MTTCGTYARAVARTYVRARTRTPSAKPHVHDFLNSPAARGTEILLFPQFARALVTGYLTSGETVYDGCVAVLLTADDARLVYYWLRLWRRGRRRRQHCLLLLLLKVLL